MKSAKKISQQEEANFHIDFMKLHKLFLCLSGLMMVIAMVTLFTKGLNMGIDFTGGLLLEVKMKQEVNIVDVRSKLETLSAGAPTIQEFGDGSIMIKIPGKEMNQVQQKELSEEVKTKLGSEVEFRRVEYVGPQVGKELVIVGIKAFVYSLIGIMAYIWLRFEWQFGFTSV